MTGSDAMAELLTTMNRIREERGEHGVLRWLDSQITSEFMTGNHKTARFFLEIKKNLGSKED